MTKVDEIMHGLFHDLGAREKAVVERRFGLVRGSPSQIVSEKTPEGGSETLEAIGQGYGITRERVRQIEAAALASMREPASRSKGYQELIRAVRESLTAHKVMRGGDLVRDLGKQFHGVSENHLAFLERFSRAFKIFDEDKKFHRFYFVNDDAKKTATKFLEGWVMDLHREKDRVLAGGYEAVFADFLKATAVSEQLARNYLGISKEIYTNKLGEIGHREWAEVNPRTIRDRIYYVLRKHTQPLHFNDIAKQITETNFDGKVALASTVHNELIKDVRFVLVGRGIYGLKESGYEPGTAKQVIKRVLGEHGPLSHREIITFVGKERILKPNTILVNLQDKVTFSRTGDGRYTVREV